MNATVDYIPSPENFKDYRVYKEHPTVFKPTDKFPIEEIKIDKKYFSFPNSVREGDVNYMINNFCLEGWEPIMISKNYFLTDGQHRLEAAKRMGLKYIDVIIVNTKVLKGIL